MSDAKRTGWEMTDGELGNQIGVIWNRTDTIEKIAVAVRALFPTTPANPRSSHREAELAAIRADITRTAAVVQALKPNSTWAPFDEANEPGLCYSCGDIDEHRLQVRRLRELLTRERELMAALEPDEQKVEVK